MKVLSVMSGLVQSYVDVGPSSSEDDSRDFGIVDGGCSHSPRRSHL